VIAVTVVSNEQEAQVVCGMLSANGIASEHRQTSLGAGVMDGLRGGPQEILVSDSDAERARKLIEG
jgi:putative signal transducing protein